jgi:hypothetical protein
MHDDVNVYVNAALKNVCRAGNATCMKRSMQDDMNVSISTVLKNICRAGNATCMKRSMQDDMNGTLYLHTGQHKHGITAHRYLGGAWDSNP